MATADSLADYKLGKATDSDASKPKGEGENKKKEEENSDYKMQKAAGKKEGKADGEQDNGLMNSGCFLRNGPHPAKECPNQEKLSPIVAKGSKEADSGSECSTRVNPLQSSQRLTPTTLTRRKMRPDRISSLPEALLCIILSFLPVEEIIRTSVLSKRWVSVWKYVLCLDFDPKHMINPCRKLFYHLKINSYPPIMQLFSKLENHISRATSMVEHVLKTHKGCLMRCRICHVPSYCESEQVNEWIEYLKDEKRISELILICEDFKFLPDYDYSTRRKIFNLHLGVFSGIQVLELSHYVLENASPFEGCNNLKSLKLRKVIISDETLIEVIHNCTYLEKLSLFSCSQIKELKICDSVLECLDLQNMILRNIDIHAKGLMVVLLNDVQCSPECVRIETPNLCVFRVYCNPIPPPIMGFWDPPWTDHLTYLETVHILEQCSGLLEYHNEGHQQNDNSQGRYTLPIENLVELSTRLNLNNTREIALLSFIFQRCTQLKKLEITLHDHSDANLDLPPKHSGKPYPMGLQREIEGLFASVPHNLRVACIKNFRGKGQELQLVRYFLTNAPVLERIVIYCHERYYDVAKGLQQSLCSPKIKVELFGKS